MKIKSLLPLLFMVLISPLQAAGNSAVVKAEKIDIKCIVETYHGKQLGLFRFTKNNWKKEAQYLPGKKVLLPPAAAKANSKAYILEVLECVESGNDFSDSENVIIDTEMPR